VLALLPLTFSFSFSQLACESNLLTNVPPVQRSVEIVEGTMMLTHRAEYRGISRNQPTSTSAAAWRGFTASLALRDMMYSVDSDGDGSGIEVGLQHDAREVRSPLTEKFTWYF